MPENAFTALCKLLFLNAYVRLNDWQVSRQVQAASLQIISRIMSESQNALDPIYTLNLALNNGDWIAWKGY